MSQKSDERSARRRFRRHVQELAVDYQLTTAEAAEDWITSDRGVGLSSAVRALVAVMNIHGLKDTLLEAYLAWEADGTLSFTRLMLAARVVGRDDPLFWKGKVTRPR